MSFQRTHAREASHGASAAAAHNTPGKHTQVERLSTPHHEAPHHDAAHPAEAQAASAEPAGSTCPR